MEDTFPSVYMSFIVIHLLTEITMFYGTHAFFSSNSFCFLNIKLAFSTTKSLYLPFLKHAYLGSYAMIVELIPSYFDKFHYR